MRKWASFIHILEELLCLRVVLSLDLIVVVKVLLLAFVSMDLEPVTVERVFGLFTADVVNRYLKRVAWPEVRLGPAVMR